MQGCFEWNVVGYAAIAIPLFIAAWQLRKQGLRRRTDFEDAMCREYRELPRCIPVKAFLGQALSSEEFQQALPSVYEYIDLSNEQVFLRMNGRISKTTWCEWCEGIKSNLSRPAFADAWRLVKEGSHSFDELRKLEMAKFAEDPRKWIPLYKRVWRWVCGTETTII